VPIRGSKKAFTTRHAKQNEPVRIFVRQMIYYSLPLFSGLLAYLFLNENIGWRHLFSALLIVAGILTANRESKAETH
jgi:EamA-like transporter family